MGFFDKLFNSTKPQVTSTPAPIHQKEKRSIFDFLNIDIQKFPDGTYIKAETGTNTSGQKLQTFRKALKQKECGIFETVEVLVIGEESMNVFFKTHEASKTDPKKLKTLFDDLYMVLGPDDDDKKKFSDKDLKDFRSTDFQMLFGRSWLMDPERRNPVKIDRDGDELSLVIWGVKNN